MKRNSLAFSILLAIFMLSLAVFAGAEQKSAPELSLGEGYILTAPSDSESYAFAKLGFNVTPDYQPLTSATLDAGVWAVIKKGDGTLTDSDPQYFYIEGDDTGEVIYASAPGTDYVEQRWTGIISGATLFDFSAAWGSQTCWTTSNIDIYAPLNISHVTSGSYKNYGFKYLFADSETLPVSALLDINARPRNTSPFYYDDNGTEVKITKWRTLARVYVVGADVPYYDVVGNATSTSYSFPLSQLKGKAGYAVAIELYPVNELLDAAGNTVESPIYKANTSYAIYINPLIMDESVTLGTAFSDTGIDASGNNKYSLKVAEKAAAPSLNVENTDGGFKVNIIGADGASYLIRSENGGWITLPTGQNYYITENPGTYYVKTAASGNTVSSPAVSISFTNIQSVPELTLGTGNTLTAPNDGESYEYAKLGFGVTPEYLPLTSTVLDAGVWSVIKKGNGGLLDSAPQYIYVEGDNAGKLVYAVATGTSFVKQRWTGQIHDAVLFDFKAAWGQQSAFTTSAIDIYSQLNIADVEAGKHSGYGFKYLFDDSEIVPVSTLKNINAAARSIAYFYYDKDGTETLVSNWKTKARVHVVGANVSYYDVIGTASGAGFVFPLSSLSEMEGYAVALELFPTYGLIAPDGGEVTDPYIKQSTSYAIHINPVEMDASVTLGTSFSSTGIDASGRNKYSLPIANKGAAPLLTVENTGGKYKVNIIGSSNDTYQYRSETSGWTVLPAGQAYFTTDTVGTYYVKTTVSATALSSNEVSVTFDGVKETPNLHPDLNKVLTAPADGESYVYAKLGFGVTPEYQPLTSAVLTEGVWAVKALGDGTYLDSAPQYIYIMGKNAGKIKLVTASGRDFAEGKWVGTYTTPWLFDWDNYTNLSNAFKSTKVSIYQNTDVKGFANGTFNTYGYKYLLADDEIVPLSSLIDLTATARNAADIFYGENKTQVESGKTRARVHIVGGEVDYYDVISDARYRSTDGYRFDLSTLNGKPGYITALELYLFEELHDKNGNPIESAENPLSTSHSLIFKNITQDETVDLAPSSMNQTGLDANGVHRFSLQISNDPRAPMFEALENNPNALRITNYIEGESYAWSKTLDGGWVEFDGDTVEFTEFGSYYIKLVGKNGEEDIVNKTPFKTENIMIEGASLVLDGAIGLRVYFGVADKVNYEVTYEIERNGVTAESGVAADEVNGAGKHYVTLPIYPKDAKTTLVTVTVTNLDTNAASAVTASVPAYIAALRELAYGGDEASIAALDVVNSVDLYTDHAANFFDKNAAVLEGVDIDTSALANIADPVRFENGLVGGEFHSTSLVLDEAVTIRHYFEVDDERVFARYTAYCNEMPIAPEVISGGGEAKLYYYDISNIPAHKFDVQYTLELVDVSGTVVSKLSFSVLNYIKIQTESTDAKMANLTKAMYNYHKETDLYSIIAQNPGQRGEIMEAMQLAVNTVPEWKEVPEYNPTIDKYSHIKAITYDGFEYKGNKTKIFAYVGFPEGASADSPVPAIVLVHGGGGHPYMEWVRVWNELGYAAIAMETTGYYPSAVNVGVDESDNSKFVYGITADFAEEGYGNAPNRTYPTVYTPVEDQWAYHGLSQVILAGNILRADSRVDADKVGITGVSWGGTMVSQVIGYDDRYSFAIPIYGTAYLGDEMRSFASFADPYVNYLWGAERNLDNATMPILWLAYNDDNNFGVPAYCKSYLHTNGYNEKNALSMLGNWSHSHGSVFYGLGQAPSTVFANWATYGTGGYLTFADQPKSEYVNCNINIPESATDIAAKVYYITEPMSYSSFDKFNWGTPYVFLTQTWQTNTSCLTVNRSTGTVSGTVPADAAGYYISISYKIDGKKCESSSVYVTLD